MTEGITVSLPDLVAKVREIAQAEPERVYDFPTGDGQCLYAFAGQPSCIVGHALVALGVPVKDLEQHDGFGSPLPLGPVDDLDRDVVEVSIPGFKYSDKEANLMSWLSVVQSAQDSGQPWGEAVATADEFYPTSS